MVVVAISQLILAYGEKVESTKVLEDAKIMLKQVEAVKTEADTILENVQARETQINQRFNRLSQNLDDFSNKLEATQTKQKDLIDGQAEAEKKIDNAVLAVNQQVKDSQTRLKKTEEDFDKKQGELSSKLVSLKVEVSKQLEELKWRNELNKLADEAIANGSRAAFENLFVKILTEKDSYKKSVILSCTMQVKSYYLSAFRHRAMEIKTENKENDITEMATDALINELMNNEDIATRCAIAHYLRTRKEKPVPLALIRAIQEEKNLDVIKRCVSSYGSITGYTTTDIFGGILPLGRHVFIHWNENQDEISKKLKESEADQDQKGKELKP